MQNSQFLAIARIVASTGKALQFAQFVREVYPSPAIDRVVLRCMITVPCAELEAVYGAGIPLNQMLPEGDDALRP